MSRAEYLKAWRKRNPIKVKMQRERVREQHRLACKRWVENNRAKQNFNIYKSIQRYPLKQEARRIVAKALKNGTLNRCSCVVCEKLYRQEVRAHAHHTDYNRPLEVMWLCHKHHRAWHKVFLAEDIGDIK